MAVLMALTSVAVGLAPIFLTATVDNKFRFRRSVKPGVATSPIAINVMDKSLRAPVASSK